MLIMSNLVAQEIVFNYDDSGNRISRKLIVQQQNDTTKNTDDEQFVNNISYSEQNNNIIANTTNENSNNTNTKQTEIANIGKENIKVYPNPVETMLVLQIENAKNLNNSYVRLYSNSGKLLDNKKIANSVSHIDMQTYSQGVYILVVMRGTKKSEYKIIKK